jgi:NADH-quinone oxidoreductase subunit G
MKCTIDELLIEAHEGETVLQAADRHGIEIPHFCYHAKLSIAGNCRLCLVKVNNLPKLMPACSVVLAPDMVVQTRSEEVQRARRQVMQFVMLNHPVDCGICDKAGECTLQDYQRDYGAPQSTARDPKRHNRKLAELSPRITLDNERCILCSRCVRFTQEISGSHGLAIVDRGAHSTVERVADAWLADAYSDNVIGLCPTGALLSRDFLYQSRVWFLEPVPSACNGCARACSVQVWRRKPERALQMPGAPAVQAAYRVTVQENSRINGPWLCNTGFGLHKAMARPRVLAAQVTGGTVAAEAAIDRARALLVGARKPAVLVSSQGSDQEFDALLGALGRLGGRLQAFVHADRQPARGEVVEDTLLIRADKNPNRAGAITRFGAVAREPFDANAGHDVVLAWGEFDPAFDFGGAHVVHLATFAPALRAEVVIPVSTHFERSGSFTNCDGQTSAFSAVFAPPPGVLHAADVFARMAP